MWSVQLFLTAALGGLVSAHMELTSPAPLKGAKNPNTKTADYEMTTPLSTSGSNYPCRGHLDVIGTPEGASVASWPAGSQQSFTIGGGAAHGGGSCQASFSEDGGKSFKVARSYVGGCPVADKPFTFTVPADIKAGPAIFAWTWFNEIGNREMYMNCASVTITGAGGQGLSNYPDVFKANIGNGCSTTEGSDLAFPNPGSDVLENSTKTGPPVGTCGGSGPSGPGNGSGSPGGSGSSAPSASTPRTSATGYGGSGSPAPSASTPKTSAAGYGGSGSSSNGGGYSAPANNLRTTTASTPTTSSLPKTSVPAPAGTSGSGSGGYGNPGQYSDPLATSSKVRDVLSSPTATGTRTTAGGGSTQMSYAPTMTTSSAAFTSTTKPGCKCECDGKIYSIVQY